MGMGQLTVGSYLFLYLVEGFANGGIDDEFVQMIMTDN